ncbi:MAG TPA: sulfur transferase domain-containing protein [Gemmatimonadaceae bacterium]|jgi:uncharacterized protein (TIGR01244 family)
MTRTHLRLIAAAIVALPSLASAQKITGANVKAAVPAPVALDTTGMFQAKYAKVGDDMFIGGQPTEKAIRELKAQGVTTIVNLRTPPEMDPARIGFDEEALAKQLGIRYVHIPMRGNAEMPYSPENLKKFADAMSSADGKVLLHCTIAWRASHMWAAYLIQYRGMPVENALKQTRSINLMDDMRMGAGDKQPVEELLGRALPEVGHPKKP